MNIDTIANTYKNLSNYIIKTPLIESGPLINELLDSKIFFKLEFLQNSGTFKARGAINNVLNLKKEIIKWILAHNIHRLIFDNWFIWLSILLKLMNKFI